MRKLFRLMLEFPAKSLLAAVAAFQAAACTGYINSPDPDTPPIPTADQDVPCPSMIPDQPTNMCPRLKNMTLTCGGNGMLHTSVGGGSGGPIQVGAKLDDGTVFSAVLVAINCQDGPREGVTFGVTYTGHVSMPESGPPCISQSRADYSQFQFGNPLYAGFEGLAKGQMHQTLDDRALEQFAMRLGLAQPAASRCGFWREMP